MLETAFSEYFCLCTEKNPRKRKSRYVETPSDTRAWGTCFSRYNFKSISSICSLLFFYDELRVCKDEGIEFIWFIRSCYYLTKKYVSILMRAFSIASYIFFSFFRSLHLSCCVIAHNSIENTESAAITAAVIRGVNPTSKCFVVGTIQKRELGILLCGIYR